MLLKQCLKAAKRVLILIHVLICYNTVTHSWLWKKKIVCKQQIWTAPSPVCTPYVCKILMDFNTVLCSCCNQRASFSVTLIKLRAGSQINIMHPLRHTQGGELEAAALRSSQEPQQTDVEWQRHSRDPDREEGRTWQANNVPLIYWSQLKRKRLSNPRVTEP